MIASNLSSGAQLFVFTMRQWCSAAHAKQCVHQRIQPFYDRFGAEQAASILDEMMCHITATAFRQVEVNCPCRLDLSEDELLVLNALRAIQQGDSPLAGEKISTLLLGPFKTTFVRIADAYVRSLKDASLKLTGVRYLSLVPTP